MKSRLWFAGKGNAMLSGMPSLLELLLQRNITHIMCIGYRGGRPLDACAIGT